MACPPSNVKFQLRRDTAANWTSANPTLQAGEPAFEIDTNKFKIGDGKNVWVKLDYIGDSPLVFTPISGNVRMLSGYRENNKILKVRSAEITGNMFYLNLATFTPTINASAIPGSTLNWDIPCLGFTVSITNPTDFLDQYISDISSTTQLAGVFSAIDKFTAGNKSATPLGGVNWNQTFTVDSDAFIQPISTTITGGTSSAIIYFKVKENNTESVYSNTVALTINWNTPTLTMNAINLSGKTFLESYPSTTYTILVTGVSNSSIYSHVITSIGGSITGNVFTFDVPIHKDNIGIPRSITTTTTFTRPASVTGTQYSTVLASTDSVDASFTYPSFWLFTLGTPAPPLASDIVNGTTFTSAVTLLGDQTKTFNGIINNNTGSAKGFWFAVRSSITQPTVFQSGSVTDLTKTYPLVVGRTITLALEPTPKPAGYSAVNYTLYGMTLQNGPTNVSIS